MARCRSFRTQLFVRTKRTIRRPYHNQSYSSPRAFDQTVQMSAKQGHKTCIKPAWKEEPKLKSETPVQMKLAQKAGVLFVCSGVLAYLAYLSIDKYSKRETGTADKYEHATNVEFPQLTLCPSKPYNREFLEAHGISDVTDFRFNAQWVSRTDSLYKPEDFLRNASIPLSEIFNNIVVDTEQNKNNKTQFVLALDENEDAQECETQGIWEEKEYYFNGICHALTLPPCLQNLGVLELSLNLLQATDLFIHQEGQFLSPNSRSRVKVREGLVNHTTIFKIAATYESVVLDSTTGKCIDYDVSLFDACMNKEMYLTMMATVGCTVPWISDKNNICVVEEKRKEAFTMYQNNRRNQRNLCGSPCTFMNIYFGPPVEEEVAQINDIKSRLVIYFRRDIKVTSEYFLISVISMIAEIGGYASLLLGFSLFNLTDLTSGLIDKWHNLRKSKTIKCEKN